MAFSTAEILESFEEDTGSGVAYGELPAVANACRNSPVTLAPLPRAAKCHQCGAVFGTEHGAQLHRSYFEARGRSCNSDPLPSVFRLTERGRQLTARRRANPR